MTHEITTEELQLILGSHALAKACEDPCFDYALKLRTGEVLRFVGAEILNPEWIRIDLGEKDRWEKPNNFPFKADRGLEIRISEIVWVMDAPDGS